MSRPEINPLKESPPNGIGDLLAAIGNNETKSGLLILMQPGIVYNSGDLHRVFMQAQGEKPGWKTGGSVQLNYCEYSLSPIGFVSKESLNSDLSTYGFEITEYGVNVGIPLAGLLLNFSDTHDVSLNDLFGATNIGAGDQKRAPSTRLDIFWELATTDEKLRAIDLHNRIAGVSMGSMIKHINTLADRGITFYDSVRDEGPRTYYSSNQDVHDNQPVSYHNEPQLTTQVFSLLAQNPNKAYSIEEVVEMLRTQDEHHRDKKSLYNRVSLVLASLRKQGYLHVDKFNNDILSEISVTDYQRQTLIDLLDILDKFNHRDPQIYEKGIEYANYYRNNPASFARLMNKAKEHSPYAQANPSLLREHILQILQEIPGETVTQVRLELKKRLEKTPAIKTLELYLNALHADGKIFLLDKHRAGHWKIVENLEN